MNDVLKAAVASPGELEAAAAELARAPIVLRASRRKIEWTAAGSLAFIALGLWEMQVGGSRYGVPMSVAGGTALALGLMGAIAAAVQLFGSATLTLTPECLVFRTAFSTVDLRWSEIERFMAWRPASTRVTLVGYMLCRPPQTRAERLSRSLGCDGAIPDQFSISTPALLALCEACHRLWR